MSQFVAMSTARFFGLVVGALIVARSSLGRLGKDHALQGGELLFEEFELHLRIDVLALQASDLRTELSVLLAQPDGGFFKVRGDLLEGFDV